MDDPLRAGFVGPAVRPGGRPSVTVVVPGLLIGEYPIPLDAAWLGGTHGVTAVVSLQDHSDLAGKNLRLRDLEAAYRDQGLAFHHIPVPDGDGAALAARLEEIIGLLDELVGRGECVYLHCNAGLNRAPTVAIAYLHACHGMPLLAARDLVKQRRPCVPYMAVLEAHFSRPR